MYGVTRPTERYPASPTNTSGPVWTLPAHTHEHAIPVEKGQVQLQLCGGGRDRCVYEAVCVVGLVGTDDDLTRCLLEHKRQKYVE